MIDRNGKYIVVAWAPHEVLWIKAALTLPIDQRDDAYRDIAAMSGRSFNSVRAQAFYQRRKEYDQTRRDVLKRHLEVAGAR